MSLLADGLDPGRVAALLAIAGTVGGGFTYLINLWLTDRAARKKDAAEEEQKISQHQERLVQRLDREKEQLQIEVGVRETENRDLVAALTRCDIRSTQRRQHIRYLEGVLTRAELSFEKYIEDDDASATHMPIKPTKRERNDGY